MFDVSLVVGTSSDARLLALQDFRYDSKCSDNELGVWKHDVDSDSWREEIIATKCCKLFLAVSPELPVQTISLRKFHKNLCIVSSFGNLSINDI